MAGYPSYRYHATEAPVVVNDEAEDKALGKGWADSPAAFEQAADEADEAEDAPKKGKGKK
jgi:hypothetical protein